MRIVHIITRLILGGAQQNTILTAAHQVQRGHEVHLAYGPIYGPEGSLLADARASGAHLHEVATLRRAVLPPHDLLCYIALRRLIRRLRPGVVHTHSSKAGILGRAAAWAERVPVVVHTIHGLPFHDQQPLWLYRAYVLAERLAAARCHALVGITQAMVDAFHREGIGAGRPFSVIPSGVDTRRFTVADSDRDRAALRAELGLGDHADAFIIGIVARLDRLKGQRDLLEVLPEIRRRSQRSVHLLLVGDGWDRPAIERLIAQRGLGDAVTLTGLVPLDRVPQYLRAMDLMALPSYQEGQGRTLVEAMLCGTPVVAYAAGGIPQVCQDGLTGRLVPVGDREGLTEAILELLHHPALARQLADAARAHARTHFSAEAMTGRLEALYTQLAMRGKRPRASVKRVSNTHLR